MPFVKGGKIQNDEYAHIADDAALPVSGAVLVSAARFLEDPEALFARAGKVGVIWPNNRDIDELVPYLGKIAAVALLFPTFRDGRAYSQARLLRERPEELFIDTVKRLGVEPFKERVYATR